MRAADVTGTTATVARTSSARASGLASTASPASTVPREPRMEARLSRQEKPALRARAALSTSRLLVGAIQAPPATSRREAMFA